MIRYTGIGSRSTPTEIRNFMHDFAAYARDTGWHLRSGGADGADTSFELGCHRPKQTTIYLPWRLFNGRSGPHCVDKPTDAAMRMAARIHPAWRMCGRGARALHARNCHQILGRNLKTPSDFVVCWTEGGKTVGGTATAIMLAKRHKIPIFNLGKNDYDLDLEKLVEEITRKVSKLLKDKQP